MGYSGDVVVGGPADVRELPALVLSKVAVGPYENNCYLLRCRQTGAQLLVDAADEPDVLLALIGSDGLESIVTTHRHGDHWQALSTVARSTGATTVAHPLDAPELPVDTDLLVQDGDTIRVGDVLLDVIHLRGHTPGGIALLYDDPAGHQHLITGDSLFPGGPGKTSGGEDFDTLMADLQAKVFDRLPDETWFYPGHGKDSTLGAERGSIPEWLARRW